jgi:hypothetical protein
MEAPEQFHYYSRNLLRVLIGVCAISIVLLAVPYVLLASVNYNSTGQTFMVFNEWLGIVPVVGFLILYAEIVFVMVTDWRGVITLLGVVNTQRMRKGKPASSSPWFVLLYIFFPFFMQPIYLIRTVREQRQGGY